MAVETITIDIQTNYKDGMSPNIDTSKQKLDKMEQSIAKLEKQINSLTKDKATVKLETQDKASSKLEKVGSLVKSLGKKVLKLPVSIIDKATAPLRKIYNFATSIKGVLTGLMTGFAIDKVISSPIALADAYSSAKIGFSTLLGESGGQKLMNQIDQFAKATPFKTSNTIEQAQRMIAMGWDAEKLIEDMKVIGDAAAATGKGDEGLQRIVTALAQIKSKGKLSTEELNQLAEAGISAKRYIAEGLGYGSGDAGLAAMSKDLQKGAVGAEAAIQAIMNGMQEYNGMMEKTANETVEGLKSQIEDTFEINIVRKWGQGLQEGAKKGLGSVVKLLDASEDGISAFGDQLHKIGSEISNFAADKLENAINKILEVTSSSDFKNADLGGKFKIVWDEVIARPFGEWWDSTGQPWMVAKMTNFGEGLGSGLSNILKGLLGFNAGDIADDAATVGEGFAKGFLEGFDGSGVWDALTESIKNAFTDALKIVTGQGDGSSWLSAALLGYGGMKTVKGLSTISKLFGGKSIGSMLLGSASMQSLGTSYLTGTELAGFSGKGLLGLLGNSGVALGSGATSAAGLVGAGAGGIAGGIGTIFSAYHAGSEFATAYNAYKSGDKDKAKAHAKSGGWTTGGLAAGAVAGAAIGSFIPVIGTAVGGLIGAGIGGISGWWKGNKDVEEYEEDVAAAAVEAKKLAGAEESLKYESKEVQDILKELGPTTEMTEVEFAEFQKTLKKAKEENLANHFGKIKLSLSEIQSLASKLTIGDNAAALSEFESAVSSTEESLGNLQSSFETMNRLNWKATLGMELDSTEIEEYKAGVDSMIESARRYVEDNHYEFTTAVSLLVDVNSPMGQNIIQSGNNYYSELERQLDVYSKELEVAVDKALEDGVISPTEKLNITINGVEIEGISEQNAIDALQTKIKSITDKINDAMMKAKMEVLTIKYGGSKLDAESFATFQEELATQVQENVSSYDEALEVSIANVYMKFNNGEGLTPEQKSAMQAELDALKNGYNAKIDEMEVEVLGFQFNTLAETYGSDLEKAFEGMDLQGTTAEKLKQAMENAMADGVDVTAWDSDSVSKYLGLDKLETETAENITAIMNNIGKTIPESYSEALTNGMATADVGGKLDTAISGNISESDFTGTSDKAVSSVNRAILAGFGSHTFSTTADIEVTPNITLTQNSATISASGDGSGSGTVSLSVHKGWIDNNAAGGYIGDKTLSWLAEEGYPEMVIPFAPHRRSRALSLWEQAGKALGVKEHASGGIAGGMLPTGGGSSPSASGKASGHAINVNMGGVTIEVKAEGNGGDLLAQIQAKKNEIANMLSEMLSEALEESFENMPLAAE